MAGSGLTRNKFRLAAILFCLAAATWLFSTPILRALGSLLVNDGPPVAADMIVVLAGDYPGDRVLKGAELAREGFAPKVIISNSASVYSHTEAELGAEFVIRHGYSPELLIIAGWFSNSTADEAEAVIGELRKRGAHRILVVTSLWHTARARRIYRRLAPDLEIHMVGSSDPKWNNGNWWIEREGRKIYFLEAVKTIADFLRI